MASYSYKLRNYEGKVDRGIIQAVNQVEAVDKLHKLPGVVLEIKEIAAGEKNNKSGNVSLKDRIIFTQQLSVMLNAGVTLVQALRGLQEETRNKKLANILDHLIIDIEGGKQFSAALTAHPKAFSNIYCEMIKSAEKTGNVAEVLMKLTVQQQKEYDLNGKVKGALIYPAIVSVLLIGVVIIILTVVLPKLTGLFTDSGAKLPLSTRMLIGISDFFVHQGYILVIGLIIGAIAFKIMLRSAKGRYIWDSIKIRIPVLGVFLKKSYMARFTDSFGSLSQAGVPVLEVFKTLRGVIGNSVYEREIDKISADVENGIKVSVAIRKSKYFPAMVGQLVSVGEQSGDLAGIFTVLSNFFEKEVDGMAKNLSTVLEPLIMIVMGTVIGFVLIAVMQPIYGLVNNV
jgi:type IV pilus assembly protein PilC